MVFRNYALFPQMVRARLAIGAPGRIVNIASIAAMVAVRTPGVAYVTARGGLIMLNKQMAAELAPHGIPVNALAPGYVRPQNRCGRLHHA